MRLNLKSSVRKEFSSSLYSENDSIAKKKTFELFESNGILLYAPDNQFTVDLQSDEFNVECEIKRLWKGSSFPFDDIQIPERKKKFAKLDKPTYFIIWNNDLTNYIIIDTISLLNSPIEEVRNKYVNKGELFFKVEKSKFKTIKDIING